MRQLREVVNEASSFFPIVVLSQRNEFDMKKSIALLGEFTPTLKPHVYTGAAIEHSCAVLDSPVEGIWVSTEDIDESLFEEFSGIWVTPGSPYKNMDKTLWAIKYARERLVPCFGTCGGFQHQIIEYARNVLGFEDAQHAEYDPYASNLFISQLACSLAGREMALALNPDSQVAEIYGSLLATEEYYCNFGVNPDCVALLKSGPMKITGSDSEGEIRVMELPGHPFFIGTLFVPQTSSTPENPHPLVTAFLTAVIKGSSTFNRHLTVDACKNPS
jgi:CTP synthase (UTP-ammonia lyase)